MRAGRSNATYVQARALEPLMVVVVGGSQGGRGEMIVTGIERASDAIDRLRGQIAKTTSRRKLEPLAYELVRALEAVDILGREARMVRFAGRSDVRTFGSQEELRYLRRATSEEAGR